MKRDKVEKFIKNWSKHRQEGKEKYVNTRSASTAVAILVGMSTPHLYRGQLTFFNLPNLTLIFLASYISARIGATSTWKRNEKKYAKLVNDIER